MRHVPPARVSPVGVVDPELRFGKTVRLRYELLLRLEVG